MSGAEPDLIRQVRELAEGGLSVGQTAKTLGLSYSQVWRIGRRHGVRFRRSNSPPKPPEELLLQFHSASEVARVFGVSPFTARSWTKGLILMDPQIRNLIEDQDGMLKRRLEKGLPFSLIAKQLSITEQQLRKVLRKRNKQGKGHEQLTPPKGRTD